MDAILTKVLVGLRSVQPQSKPPGALAAFARGSGRSGLSLVSCGQMRGGRGLKLRLQFGRWFWSSVALRWAEDLFPKPHNPVVPRNWIIAKLRRLGLRPVATGRAANWSTCSFVRGYSRPAQNLDATKISFQLQIGSGRIGLASVAFPVGPPPVPTSRFLHPRQKLAVDRAFRRFWGSLRAVEEANQYSLVNLRAFPILVLMPVSRVRRWIMR